MQNADVFVMHLRAYRTGEITTLKQGKAKVKVVLSMGCGFIQPEAITEPDFHPISSLWDKILKFVKESEKTEIEGVLFLLKNIPGTKSLIAVMMSQITQPCGEVNTRGEALANSLGAKYCRINPRTSNISFVESDNAPLINMMYEAMVGTLEDSNVDIIIDAVVGKTENELINVL